MKKIIKKSFVVCLALIMTALTLIPAFAEAEPVQLSETNVVEYPAATGEIYYTQKIGDCLTLEGGKVTIDGTAEGEEIAGHWEFVNPEEVPAKVSSSAYSAIKFLPEDNEIYSEFEVAKPSKPARFNIKKAVMELTDPNMVPTASEVEENSQLQDSSIVGVDLKCSITGANVSDFTTPKWKWVVRSFVTKSGWYQAKVTATGFYDLQFFIYVRVKGDTSEPIIKNLPAIAPIEYYDGLKAGDLQSLLESGGGEAAVPGHFEIGEPSQELSVGANQIEIVFKPDDSLKEDEHGYIFVTVNKGKASYLDAEGNPVVPNAVFGADERISSSNITTKLSESGYTTNVRSTYGKMTIEGVSSDWQGYFDTSVPGTYKGRIDLNSADANYEGPLYFYLVIGAREIAPVIFNHGLSIGGSGMIHDETFDIHVIENLGTAQASTIKPQGTFNFYVDGNLVLKGIKYAETFTWRPEKSGVYDLKAIYVPIENDTYKVADAVSENFDINLQWNIKAENCKINSTSGSLKVRFGTEVSMTQSLGEDFGAWKFYDANNKEFTPENLNISEDNKTVTFTMPDHDITVKAIDKTQSNLPGGDGNFSDFFSSFLAWLNNLLARFRALMDAVAQLLTVVG